MSSINLRASTNLFPPWLEEAQGIPQGISVANSTVHQSLIPPLINRLRVQPMLTRHSLTFFHCSHNGSKVVVKENHVRDLLGYLSPSNAHRHTWKWRGGRGEGEVGDGGSTEHISDSKELHAICTQQSHCKMVDLIITPNLKAGICTIVHQTYYNC